MAERKRLSDILMNSDRDRLRQVWQTTEAAADLKPLPSGEYRCRVVRGELFNARTGTPGYKLTLEVLEGEHAGRLVWHDIWLSDAALSMAKRDLAKLGVQNLDQLDRPLPDGLSVAAKVTLRRGDEGTEFNRVTRFVVVAVDPPAPDPFAPTDRPREGGDPGTLDEDGFDWGRGEHTGGGPER